MDHERFWLFQWSVPLPAWQFLVRTQLHDNNVDDHSNTKITREATLGDYVVDVVGNLQERWEIHLKLVHAVTPHISSDKLNFDWKVGQEVRG